MESLHALFLERGVEGFLDSSEEGAGFEIMFAFHVFAVDAQSYFCWKRKNKKEKKGDGEFE
jgi:hypothetical protein